MYKLFEEFEESGKVDLSFLSEVFVKYGKDGVFDEIRNIEEEKEQLGYDCNKLVFLENRLNYCIYPFDELNYVLSSKTPLEIIEMMEGVNFSSGYWYEYFGIDEFWGNLEFYHDIYDISSDFNLLDEFLTKLEEELDNQKDLYFNEEKEQDWKIKQNTMEEIGCVYLY